MYVSQLATLHTTDNMRDDWPLDSMAETAVPEGGNKMGDAVADPGILVTSFE